MTSCHSYYCCAVVSATISLSYLTWVERMMLFSAGPFVETSSIPRYSLFSQTTEHLGPALVSSLPEVQMLRKQSVSFLGHLLRGIFVMGQVLAGRKNYYSTRIIW